MRKMITALVAAGLLFTAACGGDDDDSAGASGGGGGGGGSQNEFCEQARELFNSSASDVPDPEAQLSQAEALLDLAPDEIHDDWQKIVEGSRTMAEATANIDPNDPEAQAQVSEQYQAQYTELMDATNNVTAYLGQNCGFDDFSATDATDDTTTAGD
jgi:hypothetical protein